MFNSLRTVAAKLTRGSSGSQLASQDQPEPEQRLAQLSEVASEDTVGSIHSFPPRSSCSRDRSRQSIDGKKAPLRPSTSGSKVQAQLNAQDSPMSKPRPY